VIAGTTDAGTHGVIGPKAIEPIYMDIELDKGAVFSQKLPSQHTAFTFVISGELAVGDSKDPLAERELGILTKGDHVFVKATSNTRFVLIAGKPLNEPVARHGPFVMNTKQELMQAFDDYSNNRF
jgi:redox-sensitive bicupin YhaK (pirin superfamily)